MLITPSFDFGYRVYDDNIIFETKFNKILFSVKEKNIVSCPFSQWKRPRLCSVNTNAQILTRFKCKNSSFEKNTQ